MRQSLYFILITLLLLGCKSQDRTEFEIDGTAKGIYNGVRVYLKHIDANGREVMNDTAIVMNEKFKMIGKMDEPTVHFLSVDGLNGNLIFMLENSEISIELDKANLMNSKVEGSLTNDGYQEFMAEMNAIRDENREIVFELREVLMPKTPEEQVLKDSLNAEFAKRSKRMQDYPLVYVTEKPNSYFSLNLIGLESNKTNFDVKGFKAAFDKMSPELKQTPKGKKVEQKLNQLYEAYKKLAFLEVGNPAPSFKGPTPDGTMLSLEDVKGKVTIIDFWAAWCGPCRRENPNVVRIYNKYHDQGLEIIGVSLDGQARQANAKQAWLDAIKQDKLAWNHVSNLSYFNDPIAKLYNIQAIPATYILDSEGKIAAKNLRGQALEEKVKELLEK